MPKIKWWQLLWYDRCIYSLSTELIILVCFIELSNLIVFSFHLLKKYFIKFPENNPGLLVSRFMKSKLKSSERYKKINESNLKSITSSDFYWKMENWISSQNKKKRIWNSSVIMVTICFYVLIHFDIKERFFSNIRS